MIYGGSILVINLNIFIVSQIYVKTILYYFVNEKKIPKLFLKSFIQNKTESQSIKMCLLKYKYS